MRVTPPRTVHTSTELRRCQSQSAAHNSAPAIAERSARRRCPTPARASMASLLVPRGTWRGRSRQGWPLACTQPSRDAAAEVTETSGRTSAGDGDIDGQLAEVSLRTAWRMQIHWRDHVFCNSSSCSTRKHAPLLPFAGFCKNRSHEKLIVSAWHTDTCGHQGAAGGHGGCSDGRGLCCSRRGA